MTASVEDALVFVQDELHDLVLEDHVHGDVGRLHLWAKQGRAKDDRHVLHSHAIVIPIMDDPVRETDSLVCFAAPDFVA